MSDKSYSFAGPFMFAILLVCLGTKAFAGIIHQTSYSFTQKGSDNFSGMDSVPANLSNVKKSTPISTYDFNLLAVPTDPFQLKADVEFGVEINQRDASVTWDSVEVSASAKSKLTDKVIVGGVSGATSGKIEFLWAVTGISTIEYTADGVLDADALKTTGQLTSSLSNDTPDIFLHDESRPTGNVMSSRPGFAGFESFFVDWSPGNTIDIDFELDVSADLNVENIDGAGFEAMLNADYSNTAVLQQINIFDGNGNLVDASLVSTESGFVYRTQSVPEPSSMSLVLIAAIMLGLRHYIDRRK